MNIHIASEEEKALVFALRFEVFVDEQKVPSEIEIDSEDARAVHIIAKDGDLTVGCARVLTDGGELHIGRLAVKRNYRGKGIGSEICKFIIDTYGKEQSRVWLNAQIAAKGFYEKLGFKPRGEIFFDAGIEHIEMEIINN